MVNGYETKVKGMRLKEKAEIILPQKRAKRGRPPATGLRHESGFC